MKWGLHEGKKANSKDSGLRPGSVSWLGGFGNCEKSPGVAIQLVGTDRQGWKVERRRWPWLYIWRKRLED